MIHTNIKTLLAITLASSLLISCSEDNKPQQQTEKPVEQETSTESNEQESSMESQESETAEKEEIIDTTTESMESKKGLYVYFEDKATFTDCSNGKTYPVAKEGNFYELEATYLALKDEPQQKLMFDVKGEYDMRAPDEGDDVDMLIPSELIGVVHKETCR
ncbi:hypothetical protein [Kangiella marina]|uniref:NlpE C-terminal OB domain-containing protein n=1 Tax=Kangiella marina TaxID=1079178 RepID=A0ABP8IE18_9GAMM